VVGFDENNRSDTEDFDRREEVEAFSFIRLLNNKSRG
jgi:hypothetical protein